MAHKRSYAAYAREDVADAKRGEPSGSLEPWASARGLSFRGSELPGQFSNVMPVWKAYVHNLCRGAFTDRHYGCLLHELDEVAQNGKGDPDMPGPYHHVRGYAKSRGLLSYVGIDGKVPREPFAAHSYWLPITKVVIRIPMTALLPAITIRSSNRFPLGGNPRLDDGGLPGFRMAGSEWVDDSLRLAVAGAVAPLAGLGAPYAGVRIDHGLVAVVRNGFVLDDATLDAMVAVAGQIADGLTALAWPTLAPQPFIEPLPGPDLASWPPGCRHPEPGELDAFVRAAAELGMVQEDPLAFHRAQPRCPVPGRALGLVRGVVPGTATEGRIGFFSQGRNTWGTYRSGVMVPARPEVSTPLGGFHDETSDLYVEVADGVAYAWPRARNAGALEAAATASRAVETYRRLGLADV